MNISAHLRLALLAIGICLILPAYSETQEAKTYVIEGLKTPSLSGHVIGVTMVISDDGNVFPTSRFNVKRGNINLGNLDIKAVSIDQLPLDALLALVDFVPELYPEALPALLSNSNPGVVAKHTSVDLFRALTPEDKKGIEPADLAALEELFGA